MSPHALLGWSLALLGLLSLSAFFSASETALISLNKIRLHHLLRQGARRASLVHGLLAHVDRLIATILIGNNVVNVAISAIGTLLCVSLVGPQAGLFLATVVISVGLLVFSEVTPKIFAAQHAERVAFALAPTLNGIIRVLHPVASFITRVSRGLLRMSGDAPAKRSPLITEEELRVMIEVGKEEGVLGDEERRMLHRIFEFGDLVVRDVMVPEPQMVSVSVEATPDELIRLLVEEGHSRVPVYQGTRPNIIGIIYVQEVLHLFHNGQLIRVADLLHAPYGVPGEKRVAELLRDFQRLHLQIAIVRGPEGQAIGLVTLEDLLEEIVGEIEEA